MAERKHPVARVRLYEAGRRHVQRYDGFARHDVAADLWRGGRVTSNVVNAEALGVGAGMGGGTDAPAAMLVDHAKLNTVVCRPFLDTEQGLGMDHFEFHGGKWLGLEGLGIGSEVRLYQYDGRGEGRTGAVSRFTLPRNPVLCVSLYRANPRPYHKWTHAPPCSEVYLGVGSAQEWALVFPYGGAAFAMRRRGGQWERVANEGRSLRLRSLEGYSPGERLLVWIAVWRGKLVVSTDGFAEDFWVCPAGPEEVDIAGGRLALWHNGGQWAFSTLPIKMATAVLDSDPIAAGYDTAACAGEVFLQAASRAVLDNEGAVLSAVEAHDTTDEREDVTDLERAWQAVLTPHVHVHGAPAFETAVSPELHAVQVGQFAEIVDTGQQAWEEISEDIERVAGHVTNDGRAAVYELSIDNALGRYAGLQEYRQCSIELGWALRDGSAEYAPALVGYVVEPEPAVAAGAESRMEAPAIDGSARLRDEKCDGRAPVFDGWSVRESCEWVLERCGIPEDLRDLEDTGVRLSTGAFDRPVWRVEPGRSWGEFLREMARFDHGAALFFDAEGVFRKGCRFCRAKRTAEDVLGHDGSLGGACEGTVRWELHTRAALAKGEEGEGAVLSIRRQRRSLHSNEFVNYVAVLGLGPDGTPVRSVALEPAALYDPEADVFVGWRKMEVAALETYTTQAEVNRLAREILQERGGRPEHVRLVTPLEPGMRVGDVMLVKGAERVGAGGQKYRIESIRHRVQRSPREIATTQISARWLREVE